MDQSLFLENDVQASCEWKEEDPHGPMGGTYESSCGELWSFLEGGPQENRVKFCHGCGSKVIVIPYPEDCEDVAD